MIDELAGALWWKRILNYDGLRSQIKKGKHGQPWRLVTIEGSGTDLPTVCRVTVEFDHAERRLRGESRIGVARHVVFPVAMAVAVACVGVVIGVQSGGWLAGIVAVGGPVVSGGIAVLNARTRRSDGA